MSVGRSNADCFVVLIPGLWMPAAVMLPLELRLAGCGFSCGRFGYASMRADLGENAARLAHFVETSHHARVHLVGHSLGGILALHAAIRFGLRAVQRIVMLGSPYRDSAVARKLARSRAGRRMLGRSILQWLVCPRLPIAQGLEVGVIAGTTAFGLGALAVRGLARPHDGVVSVTETSVPGMTAAAQIACSHSSLLVSRTAGHLVCRFLRHGDFESHVARAAKPAD